jgi:hypothetical protein
MADQKKEFQFDYTKYKSKYVSLDQLDELYKAFLTPATGWVDTAVKGLQLIFVGIYIFVRSKIIDQEYMIQKQEYEQKQNNSSRTEIDNETMDRT